MATKTTPLIKNGYSEKVTKVAIVDTLPLGDGVDSITNSLNTIDYEHTNKN